jgi:hypothetical protein
MGEKPCLSIVPAPGYYLIFLCPWLIQPDVPDMLFIFNRNCNALRLFKLYNEPLAEIKKSINFYN